MTQCAFHIASFLLVYAGSTNMNYATMACHRIRTCSWYDFKNANICVSIFFVVTEMHKFRDYIPGVSKKSIDV